MGGGGRASYVVSRSGSASILSPWGGTTRAQAATGAAALVHPGQIKAGERGSCWV
ncbi:MAG: hypothetical protein ACLSHU_11425 [Oscillospiraceae bacterium]